MSTWISPKTDWKMFYDADGNYIGDYFEPSDYNRIKNNLAYLKNLAENLYESILDFQDMGEDVYYGSPQEPAASVITRIQSNLEVLSNQTVKKDVGEAAKFYSNQAGYLVDELNRIEQMSLSLYILLRGQSQNKRRLSFRLCGKGRAI